MRLFRFSTKYGHSGNRNGLVWYTSCSQEYLDFFFWNQDMPKMNHLSKKKNTHTKQTTMIITHDKKKHTERNSVDFK